MNSNDRQLRVFLCHSSQDKPIVRELHQRLLAEAWIDPWLDEEKLLPGQDWNMEIEKAVEVADVVIVCLSNNSVTKEGYIQRELKFALDIALEKPEGTIFIIPIRFDECQVPRRIRSWQYIDFFPSRNRDRAYQRLLKSLEKRAFPIESEVQESAETKLSHMDESNATLSPLLSGFEFQKVPKGAFLMGSKISRPLALEDEFPQHPVYIPYDYWITRFPITNEQFGEFLVSTKSKAQIVADWRNKLHHPVVNVSWHEAIAYTLWLNRIFAASLPQGFAVRLPSEAEWEKAARGNNGREWPWGDEFLEDIVEKNREDDIGAFFEELFGEEYSKVGSSIKRNINTLSNQKIKTMIIELRHTLQTANVGLFSSFSDSPYQVADMMGNVIEWTQSRYAPYPYDLLDGRDDISTKGLRAIRGCFTSNQERFSVRSARRGYASPDKTEPILGFRIVLAPSIPKNADSN